MLKDQPMIGVDAVEEGHVRARAAEPDADLIQVSTEGSCVVLRIACVANGARVIVPMQLSPAASRALAVDLTSAAGALEPDA